MARGLADALPKRPSKQAASGRPRPRPIAPSSVETDRSPTGGPNERGAGEGPHTVAPPRAKYPVAPWIEILERNKHNHTKERDPRGSKRVGNPEKENKQGIESGRAPCVCDVGRSGPAAVSGDARFRMPSCQTMQILSCLLTLDTPIMSILFPFGLWACEPGWLLDHTQLV